MTTYLDTDLIQFDPATGNPTISLNWNNLCGNCNEPAKAHPVLDGLFNCYRDAILIAQNRPDYNVDLDTYTDLDQYGLPHQDYSGPGTTTDMDNNDPWSFEYDASSDPENIDQYHDVNTFETTKALDWKYERFTPGTKGADRVTVGSGQYAPDHKAAVGNLPAGYEPAQRSVTIEGMEGFYSQRLIDPLITERYHAKLLNVFRDKKTNHLRVGGIRIRFTPDNCIVAECVQNSCNGRNTIRVSTLGDNAEVPYSIEHTARTAMEDFVLSIIRHGNNHAAAWFTTRDTYYKVHSSDCDLSCDSRAAHCVPQHA